METQKLGGPVPTSANAIIFGAARLVEKIRAKLRAPICGASAATHKSSSLRSFSIGTALALGYETAQEAVPGFSG